MTTEPNAVMAEIHNRMPVILSRESEAAWLDPARKDRAEIEAMLKPCPDDWLETYQVSTLVNSPRNNVPEILKPV